MARIFPFVAYFAKVLMLHQSDTLFVLFLDEKTMQGGEREIKRERKKEGKVRVLWKILSKKWKNKMKEQRTHHCV